MVAAQQHVGHVHAAVARGPGVLRVLQQARLRGERLVDGAHLVTKGPGEQPHDGVNDGEGRELAPGEDVVAKREDVVGEGVDALVHPLVATADEQQPLLAGEALRAALVVGAAAGREEHHVRARPVRGEVVDRLEHGRGLHEHTLAAPERGVVDGVVAVVGPLPQVVGHELEDAGTPGPAHDRRVEVRVEHLGYDRERLDPHRVASHSRPAGMRTTTGPFSGTSETTSSITGSRSSPRDPRRTRRQTSQSSCISKALFSVRSNPRAVKTGHWKGCHGPERRLKQCVCAKKRRRSQRLQGFTRMNGSVRRPTKSKTGELRASQQEVVMLKSYQRDCTAKICHRSDDCRNHRFCRFLRRLEPEIKQTSLYILTAGGGKREAPPAKGNRNRV